MCCRFCDMVGIKLLIPLLRIAVLNISQFHRTLSTATPSKNNPQQNYHQRLPFGSVAINICS